MTAESLHAQRSGGTGGAAPGAVESQVLEASNAWADALYRNDIEAIDRMLADDFITIQVTQSGVALVEKQVQLDSLRQAPASRPRVPRELDRARVRVYGGDVAILTGVASYTADAPNGQSQTIRSVIAEVWVNTGGRWRLSHFQPTPAVRPNPQ